MPAPRSIAAGSATENKDTSTRPVSPSAATMGRATAMARPTENSGIAAPTGERYTINKSRRISPTVAAVIPSICRSIAVNSSAIVAPGPVTYTRRPRGGPRRATVSRTAPTESVACEVPIIPESRIMTVTARRSALCPAAAVAGSDHRSVTVVTCVVSARNVTISSA